MQAGSAAASVARVRAIKGAILSAAVIAALVVAPAATLAAKGGNSAPWIAVNSGSALSLTSVAVDSHFVASGCGFRANGSDYYLVVYGPAPDTASLGYWVDSFTVGGDGCGSATPTWASSGVDGTFNVYVVRSPSGNPWQAQPDSNIVTISIVN